MVELVIGNLASGGRSPAGIRDLTAHRSPSPCASCPAAPSSEHGRRVRCSHDVACCYRHPDGIGSPADSSLDAKEAELRAAAAGTVARVFRDRASGLREDRTGLEKLLAAAADGQVTVVRVTHEDRRARSGAGWLRRLLAESDRCLPGGTR